jgi:hypothetical protein
VLSGTRVGVVRIGDLIRVMVGGSKAEPNKHMFDDMVAGKTPRSSVPDPTVCD